MNPLKLTKILLLSLLSLFAFTQTIFALNVKNIPDNVYTLETMPQTKEELCVLWSGYSYEHTRVEVIINPPNWQNRVFVDFKCFYDDGKEKLQAGWRQFELKAEETPKPITLTNKTFPNEVYEPSAIPDTQNKLNYCEITGPYQEKYLNLVIYNIFPQVSFKCDYNDGITSLNAGWTYFYHKGVILGCMDDTASNYNPQANYQEEETDCNYSNPPPPQIEGCTDSAAINYNPSATIHVESMCQYPQNPPTSTPQDITGSFEKSQVSIGATTWTIKFILNVPNTTLDPSTIQTWNKFTAVDSTTNDKTLTITLRQFDDQRLDVECTNYEITIPRHALTTTNGDTNPNPISGNFEVVGCQNSNTDPQGPNSQNQDEESQPKHENTIKESNFYLSLYDTDEKGKVYINLTNTIYILGFISFFLVLFFVLFGFIKNSFLGKSKR